MLNIRYMLSDSPNPFGWHAFGHPLYLPRMLQSKQHILVWLYFQVSVLLFFFFHLLFPFPHKLLLDLCEAN